MSIGRDGLVEAPLPPTALQAFTSLLQALVSLSPPAPARPLLASRPALRASLAASTLSALRSPRAAPTDPLRTLRLLHRLMGAAGVAKAAASAAATKLAAGIAFPREGGGSSGTIGLMGGTGVTAKAGSTAMAAMAAAKSDEEDGVSMQAMAPGSGGVGTCPAEAESWWDAVYIAVRPLMARMGARQLSGLLYLLASMVDASGGDSDEASASALPAAANQGIFELPPSEWVEEALNHVIGEGRSIF